jgi:hypothetical protein
MHPTPSRDRGPARRRSGLLGQASVVGGEDRPPWSSRDRQEKSVEKDDRASFTRLPKQRLTSTCSRRQAAAR